MNQQLPQEVFDLLAREERHFSRAPEAFFQAWKRGAEIAGPEWFGDGTSDGMKRAYVSVFTRFDVPMFTWRDGLQRQAVEWKRRPVMLRGGVCA